jgi:hypothetical protein
MLNKITEVGVTNVACADAAFQLARPRPRFGAGAFPSVLVAATPTSAYALATARPRTGMAAAAAGKHLIPASAGITAQTTSQQSMYMTRISANGGGALGPHLAREPV